MPRVIREKDGAVVGDAIELAWGFLGRLRGLMGRASLAPGEGLWLRPCSSIHMMFMRFPIDVLFLDRDDRVARVKEGVRPWLGLAACPGAASAIELAAGEAARRGVAPGDRLRLVGEG